MQTSTSSGLFDFRDRYGLYRGPQTIFFRNEKIFPGEIQEVPFVTHHPWQQREALYIFTMQRISLFVFQHGYVTKQINPELN